MLASRASATVFATIALALSATAARAGEYNPYVTVDYLERVAPRKSVGDSERPIVIGTVPNSGRGASAEKRVLFTPVTINQVPQEPVPADDLPAPPKIAGPPKAPQPAPNGYGNLATNGTAMQVGAPKLAAPRPVQFGKRIDKASPLIQKVLP